MSSWLLLVIFASSFVIIGCSSGERLSTTLGSISREYSKLQDEVLLLNILRRSASLPTHFTSLTTIRGRNRLSAGANASLPLGGDAPANFTFNPQLSIEQGPLYEVSTQDNQEFYRGYTAPVDTKTIYVYFRQGYPPMMLLMLFLDKLEINSSESKQVFTNNPYDTEQFEGFQRLLKGLIDQGLAMEEALLVHNYGPELDLEKPPTVDQMLSLYKENMVIEEIGKQRYQLMETVESARFCFRRPQEQLFKQAQCTSSAISKTFNTTDSMFFGSTQEGRVIFEAAELGNIVLQTRSLAEIFDYLGKFVHSAQESESLPTIETAAGHQPLIAILPAWKIKSAAVTAEFAGIRYAIPMGNAAGYSGTVLSIIAQLLAQVQSIQDLPITKTITILGQ